MPKRELQIGGLPAPGEPLKPDIGPENQRLIDEDLEERMIIMRAKLPKRQHAQLVRRFRKLARSLKRAGYNELLQQRVQCLERYETLKAELQSPDVDVESVKAEGREVADLGRRLNEQIAALQPIADDFRFVSDQLESHAAAIRFEQKEAEDRAAFRREKLTWERQIKSVFKQSPRLHWRGLNKRGKEVTKIPRIDHVFIKPDSMHFRIRISSQGPFERLFGKWHSALPYGVDVDALSDEKTLKNLSAATGRNVEFETGKRGMSVMYKINRLDATDGIPNKVLYGNIVDWYPLEDHDMMPWPAGVSDQRIIKFFSFEQLPHVLIAGSTQSGKSNFVNQLIACISTMNRPDRLRLVLVDNKGGIEFTHWSGLRHLARPIIKKAEHVLQALRDLRVIMERRFEAFERVKAKSFIDFNNNRVVDEDRIPRIVCLIDEMATLQGIDDTVDIQNEIRALVSQGRAVGVHMVLCTQHPSVDVLPGWIKTNMGLRVSGKMPSQGASMVILDTESAAKLPNNPGRMIFSIGREEIQVQVAYISDAEISKAVGLSRNMPAGDDSEFQSPKSPLVVREKFTKDDFIHLALECFGGSLASEKIWKEAGGNDVVELRRARQIRKEIVEQEGPIVFRGKEYKLIKRRTADILVPVEPAPEFSIAESL